MHTTTVVREGWAIQNIYALWISLPRNYKIVYARTGEDFFLQQKIYCVCLLETSRCWKNLYSNDAAAARWEKNVTFVTIKSQASSNVGNDYDDDIVADSDLMLMLDNDTREIETCCKIQ